jgi:heme/copper-type cytochrome/quinol oxidase subunit 1
VYDTLTGDRRAAANPWTFGVDDPNQAMSLEWMLPSPPPFHTYEELTPIKDTVGVKA